MDFLLHPDHYLEALGPLGVAISMAIIFAESGLFFGFFLPGDSLLLTCGLLAYKGVPGFHIWFLVPGFAVMAVLGDNVGYWFGNKVGPPIFSRPESRFFKPQNLAKAKEFYDKYGPITLVLARFMPFIRTFVPIVAGAVKMEYRTFFLFNVIGGVLWGAGVTLAGFLLGAIFPPAVLDRYFTLIVIVVILLSASPTMLHLWNENKGKIIARVRGQEPAE
jgi:membrane-associated protein